MMYIQNDLIEAVPLEKEYIATPGYLGKIKRALKIKYELLLAERAIPAEFLVVNVFPFINPISSN